jgi:hypothetical protein
MDMLKCCLNWKVLVGLAAVAVGVLIVEPQIFWSALPTLAVLICPLSMGLMMFGMGKMGGMGGQQAQSGQQYTCPMHPEVRQDQPGRCAKCGMDLVPPTANGVPLRREERVAELQAQLRLVSDQQAALQRQMGNLEMAEMPVPTSRAIREAEQVAWSAGKASERA